MNGMEAIRCRELSQLCEDVRRLVTDGDYDRCDDLIRRAMEVYPHAPQPHNLMGILMERLGDHMCAMKHFRAAWALDPTYTPAGRNLSKYATFSTGGPTAFALCDTDTAPAQTCTVVRDAFGVEHITRRKRP